jgi:hypothetical protein
MKKIMILLLAVMSAGVVFGQKQKVAIYTEDKSGKNYVEFAGEFLTNAIIKRGAYTVIECTAQFLKVLGKEQGFQRSGAVSESQIDKLGEQLGVQLVCAVKIDVMEGQYFISAELIDVETAGIKGTAKPKRFSADNLDEFEKACEKVVASLFGER